MLKINQVASAFSRKRKTMVQAVSSKSAEIVGGVGLASVSVASQAADALDWTVVTGAIAVGGLAAAILGMGAIKLGPNLAKWGTNKLASFFG